MKNQLMIIALVFLAPAICLGDATLGVADEIQRQEFIMINPGTGQSCSISSSVEGPLDGTLVFSPEQLSELPVSLADRLREGSQLAADVLNNPAQINSCRGEDFIQAQGLMEKLSTRPQVAAFPAVAAYVSACLATIVADARVAHYYDRMDSIPFPHNIPSVVNYTVCLPVTGAAILIATTICEVSRSRACR
jgi:hypothetical protein